MSDKRPYSKPVLRQIPLPVHLSEVVRQELEQQQLTDEAEIEARKRAATLALICECERLLAKWIGMQNVLAEIRLTDPQLASEQWRQFMIAMLGVGDACLRIERALHEIDKPK